MRVVLERFDGQRRSDHLRHHVAFAPDGKIAEIRIDPEGDGFDRFFHR